LVIKQKCDKILEMTKSDQPLVSVLLPVYNGEKHLRETLYSVINQTYQNLEIVAINDGSTDSSKKILGEFAKIDSRIKIINKKNGGIVSALNRGINEARGDFLSRIDSDDVNFPKKIEQEMKVMLSDDNIVLVCSSFEVMNEDGEFLYREVVPTRGEDIKRLMYVANPIGHSTVLMRKSAVMSVGSYSDQSGPVEDYDLWTRLTAVGKIAGVTKSLLRFRVNPDGITQTKNQYMIECAEKVRDLFWENYPPAVLRRSELINIKKYYQQAEPELALEIKRRIYRNIALVAWAFRPRGRKKDFWRQIFALALIDRSSNRIARDSFKHAIKCKLSRKTS